ncbi:hypothetical protein BU16DRAFT_532469 [Lophium mytilinum]|uniref:Uncharacterized protein n=1 Tax=Lophium mytilinum TaxID=390894 RepID=A0A6A6RF13_9PEZI|nr:hypothetical protein BU16DRAFT_532469 [Lophium mytilinum]
MCVKRGELGIGVRNTGPGQMYLGKREIEVVAEHRKHALDLNVLHKVVATGEEIAVDGHGLKQLEELEEPAVEEHALGAVAHVAIDALHVPQDLEARGGAVVDEVQRSAYLQDIKVRYSSSTTAKMKPSAEDDTRPVERQLQSTFHPRLQPGSTLNIDHFESPRHGQEGHVPTTAASKQISPSAVNSPGTKQKTHSRREHTRKICSSKSCTLQSHYHPLQNSQVEGSPKYKRPAIAKRTVNFANLKRPAVSKRPAISKRPAKSKPPTGPSARSIALYYRLSRSYAASLTPEQTPAVSPIPVRRDITGAFVTGPMDIYNRPLHYEGVWLGRADKYEEFLRGELEGPNFYPDLQECIDRYVRRHTCEELGMSGSACHGKANISTQEQRVWPDFTVRTAAEIRARNEAAGWVSSQPGQGEDTGETVGGNV